MSSGRNIFYRFSRVAFGERISSAFDKAPSGDANDDLSEASFIGTLLSNLELVGNSGCDENALHAHYMMECEAGRCIGALSVNDKELLREIGSNLGEAIVLSENLSDRCMSIRGLLNHAVKSHPKGHAMLLEKTPEAKAFRKTLRKRMDEALDLQAFTDWKVCIRFLALQIASGVISSGALTRWAYHWNMAIFDQQASEQAFSKYLLPQPEAAAISEIRELRLLG